MEKSIRYLLGIVVLSLAIASVLTACKKDSDSGDSRPTHVIKSIYPDVVAPGAVIIITGEHFTTDKNAVTVNIGGKPATISSADSSEIVIQLPQDAISGILSVTIDKRTVESPTSLIISVIAPMISEVNPATAAIGEEITVTGKNFANNLTVSIGDKPAEAQDISATSFKVTVPEGTNNARVIVTSSGGTAVSPAVFYTPARITSLSSSTGIDGEEITIIGENFTPNKKDIEISFGEGKATQEDIVSVLSTEIKVKAPTSGTNGRVIVKQFGTESNGRSFGYIPSISSFEPAIIEPGEILTIHGHRFGSTNIVYLNRGITPEEITPTSIKVKIPSSARDAKVQVRVNNTTNSPYVSSEEVLKVVNIWIPLSPINQPSTLSPRDPIVIGSKAYFIGSARDIRIFDLINLTWSIGPDKPTELDGSGNYTHVVKDGKAYFGIGGKSNGSGTGTSLWYEFDPSSTTQFKKLADFPYETYGTLAFLHDNKIYAGLGRDGERKLYLFDPAGNAGIGTWTEAFDVTASSQTNAIHFVSNGKLYFGAGLTPEWQPNAEIYSFEPDAQNPTPVVTNLPFTPGYIAMHSVSIANKAYLGNIARFYRFNPATTDWTELARPVGIDHLMNIDGRCILIYQNEMYEYIPRP